MSPVVLLLSIDRDVHLDPVVDELRDLGASFVRLNTNDFPVVWQVRVDESSSGARRVFSNTENGFELDWANIGAVWYRRPSVPGTLHPAVRPEEADFVARESHALVQYLTAALPPERVRWVSWPSHTRRANSKLVQFDAARAVNLRIPATVITNSPAEARRFVSTTDGEGFLVKRLSGTSRVQGRVSFFSARIDQADLMERLDSVALCPTMIQEYVPKRWEYRITVIGHSVFTCRIESQADSRARTDWRAVPPNDLKHTMVRVPDLEDRVLSIVTSLGLNFAAVDVVETPAGEHVFLEVNPNGQWVWIEDQTGAPMCAAMAALLSGRTPTLN